MAVAGKEPWLELRLLVDQRLNLWRSIDRSLSTERGREALLIASEDELKVLRTILDGDDPIREVRVWVSKIVDGMFRHMTWRQLVRAATKAGIRDSSRRDKEQLIAALEEHNDRTAASDPVVGRSEAREPRANDNGQERGCVLQLGVRPPDSVRVVPESTQAPAGGDMETLRRYGIPRFSRAELARSRERKS